MTSDLSDLHKISDEFLMFLAHGQRPTTLVERSTKPHEYFNIPESDNNLYITFSDIGTSLYQLPINIIMTSLSSSYAKDKFKTIIKNTINLENRFEQNQILLLGLIYNAFFENLAKIIKSEKEITSKTIDDLSVIMSHSFSDLKDINYQIYFETNTFEDLSANLIVDGKLDLQIYYNKLINSLKINEYLVTLKKGEIPKDNIFNKLMFGEKIPHIKTIQCIISIYKIIILIICSMMKQLKDSTMYIDDIFYLILTQNFIKNFLITENQSNISLWHVLNRFHPIYNNHLIEKYKLVLKVYFKNKSTPNFNYYVNGYFLDNTSHIVKVGLYKFDTYYDLIENSIYNPSYSEDKKFSKKIIPLEKKCIGRNRNVLDEFKRSIGQTFSIANDSEALSYVNENWKFMNESSLYPALIPREFEPTIYINPDSGEEKIEFTKGIIRTLETLIIKRKIFGNNNIVLLLSCASSDEKNVWDLRRARRLSITEQNKLKYLKYKKKYLELKKQLN